MSGETIILQQVTILDPSGPYHQQTVNVTISPAGILTILDSDTSSDEDRGIIKDGTGAYLSPGWVDVGTTIQDPGGEWKESAEALAKAAQLGGFTTLLPYPSTIPIPENAEIIRGLISRFNHLPVQIYPMGAASEHLDGKEMSGLFDMYQAGVNVFSDGVLSLSRAGTLLRILRYLRSFEGILMTSAITPEWAETGQMHEGAVSTSLGLPGIPDIAEVISVERDLNILRYVGAGNLHIGPLSTSKAVEIVHRASEEGLNVSSSVLVDHFYFTDEDLTGFDENLKVLPPFRTKENLSDMIQLLKEGKIEFLSTGHRAEGIEEKQVEFSQAAQGMLTLQTAFASAVSSLIKPGHISPEEWVRLISVNPRRKFGLSEAHIDSGSGEWTLFSSEGETSLVKENIPSRAKNSPHLGRSLPGKVLGCGVKGTRHFESF